MDATKVTMNGVVVAWGCSKCGRVHGSGNYEAIERHGLGHQKRMADLCCRCRECNAELEGDSLIYCDACEKRLADEREAARPAFEAENAKRQEALEASLAKSLDRDASLSLKKHMSGISEDYYCAGWLMGLEKRLWTMLADGADRSFGMGVVTGDEIATLKRLHEKSGGWWRWDDPHYECLFVTTDEWLDSQQPSAQADPATEPQR